MPAILCAVTIFLGAFLLFQVQPMIAKTILPWFGGSAAVWSAALMFFQTALLAGYAYAYWITAYCKPRTQTIVHASLLLVSCALLPILPDPAWQPLAAGDPSWRILTLLAATIGLPYFLLAATSPLLQAWFVNSSGSQMPYWLFAVSNAGSMLALLSFPLAVEPHMTSSAQAYGWSGLYVLFAAVGMYAATVGTKKNIRDAAAHTPVEVAQAPPRLGESSLWVVFAACSSILLMAVTRHLTVNVAPIPLLWVLPLALYLLTFILAFASDRCYSRVVLLPWVAGALWLMAYGIWISHGNLHIRKAIPIYLAGLFLCCLFCHGELALRRPAPRYLTRFYLLISLGGALGGIFVALIAPRLFVTFLELPLVLAALAVLVLAVLWNNKLPRLLAWTARVALFAGTGLFIAYMFHMEQADRSHYRLIRRNFYGTLRVRDDNANTGRAVRSLRHGTVNHGSQRLSESDRYTVTSYYGPSSGIGRVIAELQSRGPIRYGVVGLGAGVLSGFTRPGDYLRFYEIDADVHAIAQLEFSFLAHAAEQGVDIKVLLGDGRLTLKRQAPQHYDLLVIDAFSSDAVPVHLLTREALDIYFRHLKPTGVLALNITNRYLDLAPVCRHASEHVQRPALVIDDEGDWETLTKATRWVLITSDRKLLQAAPFAGAKMYPAMARPGFRGWTDEYSSLWPLVRVGNRSSN